jgi:hypothetical protein
MAHLLFPGGVLVEEKPWEHAAAVARTAALMADRSVPAIFEAAFEYSGVRVRVDVLERLPNGYWGMREVKSSGEVKDHHYDDVAVQVHVLRNIQAARVMMPDCDWNWLKAVKKRLQVAARPHSKGGPVITSLQLLELGQQLMTESKSVPNHSISMSDAIRYRDGLMFAFIAFIPIRRKNLAALESGRHLVREGQAFHV